MIDRDNWIKFEAGCSLSLTEGHFVKLSLGNYCGDDPELKNIYVKRVDIRKIPMLSFTYRYKRRDIIKNYPVDEGLSMAMDLLSKDFRIATLITIDKELILELNREGKIVLRTKGRQRRPETLTYSHDRPKAKTIEAIGKRYLTDLGITDERGNVFRNAQDKYKQINHYIEILSPLIKDFSQEQIRKVVDMGSGKGYLTFGLYDYLSNVLRWNVEVLGVELREDLVSLCNEIAVKSEFNDLRFFQGTIEQHDVRGTDLLIALHACDTATDDAIFKGIEAGAKLIAVAPCCHKQIRKEIEKSKIENDLSFLTRYGIFLERQAEMITDGMRALILEYFGYKAKVMEFISDVHTPKNVLIVGSKSSKMTNEHRQRAILSQLRDIKVFFGIQYHHLERLLKLEI